MYDGRLDELWNSKNFKSLRQDFIDGKQPKECEICWNEENNNVRSYRENLIDWLVQVEDLDYSWSLTGHNNCKLGASGLFCKLAKIYENH